MRHMTLTEDKLKAIWEMVKDFKSWFSDLTVGRYDIWCSALLNPDSIWYEICRGDELVGLVCLDKLSRLFELEIHFLVFDRRPNEKLALCKEALKWIFKEFPMLNRVTTEPPAIYFASIRLAQKLGFLVEGSKREAILIGGNKVDQMIMGLLRREICQP